MGNHKRRRKRRHDPIGRPMPQLHPSVRCTINGRPFESFAGIDRSAAPEPLAGHVLEWTMIDDPDASEPPIYFTIAPPRSVFDEIDAAIAQTSRAISRDLYDGAESAMREITGLGDFLVLPPNVYERLRDHIVSENRLQLRELQGFPAHAHDDRVDALMYGMRAIADAIRTPVAEVGAAMQRFAAETARRPPFRLEIDPEAEKIHPAGIACWKCHRTHSPQAACRR